MRGRYRCAVQDGFSIIEVIVAALILAVGVAGTLLLISGASASTQATSSTEGATNLTREITERVRELPYGQLATATATTQLQGLPGLAGTGAGPDWTVVRRGITYTIALDICALDDPKDGIGSHSGATFCPSVAPSGTSDASPQDFQKVTVDVAWHDSNQRTRHLRQVVLVSGRGADGPTVSALVATSPSFPKPAAPVVSSTTVTSITFKATADSRAAQVQWYLDGALKGNATPAGNGTDWTFTLPVSSLPDKSYEVAVQAVDARGVLGSSFFIPLLLNRYAPPSPTGVTGAVNTVYDNGQPNPVAEISWDSQDNVLGYRVYRPDGTLACPDDLQTFDDSTDCMDLSPQDGYYGVVAVYQDANGNVSETNPTQTQQVIANPFRTFYFKNSTSYTGSAGCGSAPKKADMFENLAPGGDANFNAGGGNNLHRFCGQALSGPINLAPRNLRVPIFFKNPGTATCPLSVRVIAGGLSTTAQSANVTPAATTITEYDFSWPVPSMTVPANTVPVVEISYSTSTVCDKTEVHFNGPTYRSRLEVPDSAFPAPNPPTSVTSTMTSDGLQLSWNAPSSGMTPAFYRIYRDGYDYTDRYDATEDATPTYTDPDRDTSTTHTYYVTTVASNLAESDPAPLAPATFP